MTRGKRFTPIERLVAQPAVATSAAKRSTRAKARGVREAFTLIELLVVVAIIAILAAMLLPVLGRAREMAKRTVCMSNLKQQGLGILNYADDSAERVPPFSQAYGEASCCYQFPWGGWEWPYYHPWTTIYAWPNSGGAVRGPLNLGLLKTSGYVTDPQVFYCPSMRWWEFTYGTYSASWSSLPPPSAQAICVSYNYNPHRNGNGGHSPDWGDYPKYRSLREFPTDRCVVVDLLTIWRVDDVAHSPGSRGWNLLFIDGSARFARSAAVYDYVVSQLNTGDDWQVMEAALGPLETGGP